MVKRKLKPLKIKITEAEPPTSYGEGRGRKPGTYIWKVTAGKRTLATNQCTGKAYTLTEARDARQWILSKRRKK